MSKTYWPLIGTLVVVAIIVGSLAFYKSTVKPNPPAPVTATPSTISTTQPIATPSATNQIPLIILTPKDGASFSGKIVQVIGKTIPNASVSANGRYLKATTEGNFTITVNLKEGVNYIDITATDNSSQSSNQKIMVTFTSLAAN